MGNDNRPVALITGASAGIGAAAAHEMVKNGYAVVLMARSKDKLEQVVADIGQPDMTAIVAGDVADQQAVSNAVQTCIDTFGSIDVLVNNAGLIDPIARIEDSDVEAWSHVMDVNVKGVYYGIRAALGPMKEQGGGTIINISSGAATGALEGWSHYCASKAAVLSLTKCVHKEEAENGIRMVGLSPGTVATEMQVQIKASGVNPVSQLDPSVHIPAQWVGQAIVFLCTSAADPFLGTDFTLKADEERKLVGLPGV
ncbi:MAG: SDR family oxidoreductase [Rhizobiaceae bacterium]|nr:SDR family oxidoreductase [Hyphomicrobiales bacterium]NRB30209.1 SDR family oxidoreductase [Rhizobiaceae bacterium]